MRTYKRTHIRTRVTFTLFLSQWRYHYRAARHVIPACTCLDYLYDGRRSLPRREKCTLDAGNPAAYTTVSRRRIRVRACVMHTFTSVPEYRLFHKIRYDPRPLGDSRRPVGATLKNKLSAIRLNATALEITRLVPPR